MLLPETSVLKMPAAAKFQPKCRPMGSHSVRVAAYAAPSMAPAIAMVTAPQRPACGLSRCDRPKSTLVTASEITVPVRSSMIRNSTPRYSTSSVTEAPAMRPNRPTAPVTVPMPWIS